MENKLPLTPDDTHTEVDSISVPSEEVKKIHINHVMSKDIKSTILDDILGYIIGNTSDRAAYTISIEPVEEADVYHYHRPHLETNLPQKSIVTVHHDLDDIDAWVDFDKFRQPYQDADKIVCLNSYQKAWLLERGYKKTTIIPHGYNHKLLYPKTRQTTATDKTCLGIASKRYARRVKGEALLLDMAKRLSPEIFSFFLIGAGRAQEANILGNMGFEVKVYEYLPYRLFQKFYEQIDALIIYSWFEGGPACLPEAISTATPLFSTRVGMAYDYLIPGENGCFLTRDPAADATLLMRFAVDKSFAANLKEGALKRSSEAPTWSEVAENYLEVYREVACNE